MILIAYICKTFLLFHCQIGSLCMFLWNLSVTSKKGGDVTYLGRVIFILTLYNSLYGMMV